MDIIYTLWLRNVKRYIRSKSRMVGSLGMPMFLLLVLGFGLNSVVAIPGMEQGYIGFIIPGIISMSVLFTSVFAGIQIIWDKQFGFLKETLVAPVSRLEIMLGQTLGGATTALIQGLIIFIVSLLIGLEISSIPGFLIVYRFHGAHRAFVHGIWNCHSFKNGGYARFPAYNELRHLPDIRFIGCAVPY